MNFLQPINGIGNSLYRDVNVKGNNNNTRVINIGNNNGMIIGGGASFKDSEADEMFASSELNNAPMQPNPLRGGVTQATFGYEPRVPTVTVNPHNNNYPVSSDGGGLDNTSGTGSQ